MLEAAFVMTTAYNYLFEVLDPISYEILGRAPGDVFQRHFLTLFCEFD